MLHDATFYIILTLLQLFKLQDDLEKQQTNKKLKMKISKRGKHREENKEIIEAKVQKEKSNKPNDEVCKAKNIFQILIFYNIVLHDRKVNWES